MDADVSGKSVLKVLGALVVVVVFFLVVATFGQGPKEPRVKAARFPALAGEAR